MKKILLFFLVSLGMTLAGVAQDRSVSGKVTSAEDGQMLPGVSVAVKGTTKGVVTAADGTYKINAPDRGVLVFSFVGMLAKEVMIGNQTTINVQLTPDTKALAEVVVTALGIQKNAKSIGYAVSDLKNEQLNVARNTNIVNALSGKVAGVRVAGSNGMTGSGSAIFIRGFTTFTASNQPLFVVDGIPIDNGGTGTGTATTGQSVNQTQKGVSQSNRGFDLNQDDIESISVLKGPAAAALYGSRAASGAIIVTTKKGKVNGDRRTSVSYSGSYNVVEVNRFPDYQNEFAQGTSLTNATTPAAKAIFQANADQSNWGPAIAGQRVVSAFAAADRALFGLPDSVALTAYPNNVKDMFRTGFNMQHNLAFSGASEKTNYYFSYGYLREKGFMEANELWRHSFTLNASTQISKRLNIGTNIQYIANSSDRSQINNQLSNPLFRGWFTPRNVDLKGMPVQRPDGTQVFYNANTDNPYWSYRNNLYHDNRQRVIGNVNLTYDFTDWLSLNYKIGTDYFSEYRKTVDGIGARGQANHNAQQAGAVGERTISRQEISSYLNLTFKKNLTDDINVNLLVGNEVNKRKNDDTGILGFGLVTPGYYNISNATTLQQYPSFAVDGAYNQTEQRLLGVYGDLQLSYRNWLNLNITGRNDWSSTFRKGNRSYFYPSVAGSVVLTDAISSLKENTTLSFAKIRANWAKVGREAPIYSTDSYYSGAAPGDGWNTNIVFPFQGVQGRSYNDGAGNPVLGPEFTTSKEVGIELRLFQNKIGLELTRFWQKSTNIILSVPIASASGFTSQTLNSGEMEALGWEWNLNITPVRTQSFRWEIGFNGSRIRNNVLSLAPGVQNIAIGGFSTAQNRIEAGQPFGVIYGNALLRNAAGQLVIDNNGLPIVDTRGSVKVGNPNPNWTGGVVNTVSFKGLSLNFLIDIRRGGDILSRVVGDLYRTGSVVETTAKPRFDEAGTPLKNWVIDGVRQSDGQPNTTTITAQQYWSNLYNFNVPGEFIFDASWVRLREASIFYAIPKTWLSKTPFTKLDIGFNGRNLLLWTKMPHIDPEVNLLGASNSQGIEFNSSPQARTYGVVLKATF